jgi:hypothetical protein
VNVNRNGELYYEADNFFNKGEMHSQVVICHLSVCHCDPFVVDAWMVEKGRMGVEHAWTVAMYPCQRTEDT